MLTWSELLRTIELALKWVVGLSLVFELWAASVVRGPVAPNFIEMPDDPDPQIYWTRGDLFDLDARIQGVVGNANVLSIVCLIAIILVAVRLAARQRHRALQVAWLVVAAFLYLRADSATGHVAFAVAVAVAVIALLMRRITTRAGRTRLYALVFSAAAAAIIAVVLLWDRVTDVLGRSDGLSGRDAIWADVIERASAHPAFGNGFATPSRLQWDDAFHGWIVDHDLTVFHAHNMWIDVFLQLGVVGVAVALVVFVVLPRRGARGSSRSTGRGGISKRTGRTLSLSLAPLLIMAVLLTQGLTESGPLMLWGGCSLVSLTFPHQAGARHRRRRGRVTAGCAVVRLTDRPRHRSAMIRMLRARLIDLLGSADFARVYTLICPRYGAVGLRHRHIASAWTLYSMMAGLAVVGAAMLWVRRRELTLIGFAPTMLLGFVLWALVSVAWAFDRWEWFTGWLELLCYAFVAVTIAQVRDTMQVVRALGDVLRALLGLSIALEVLVGILLDTSFPQLAMPVTSPSSVRFRACSAPATCSRSWR